jgi:MYXO-CTERM domain-containing protein
MKVLRSLSLGRVLFWGCLLAFASPAQATLLATTAVLYDEGFFNGPVTIQGATANGGGASAIGYNSTAVPGLATSGYAMAEYGALHASAFSAVANPGVGATSQTRGLGGAVWSDQLTFSSATLTGPAFARAFFSLSGGLNSLSESGAAGNSTIAARIQAGGNTVFSTTGQLVSQNGAITINDMRRGQAVNGAINIEAVPGLTGVFAFDIPFEFGVAFQLTGTLDAFTQSLSGVAGSEASAYSNFASTGLWQGISEVHLADGTVLSGYSLGSASGFDWLSAFPSGPVSTVPLPATPWLFGAGLLGLIGVVRRRKIT